MLLETSKPLAKRCSPWWSLSMSLGAVTVLTVVPMVSLVAAPVEPSYANSAPSERTDVAADSHAESSQVDAAEEKAVLAIKRAGYIVTRDESGHVSRVSIAGRKLDEELMQHVKNLPHLNRLGFCGAVIKGGYLAGLKNLRTLAFAQYGVFTKEAMKDLGGLTNLEELTGLPILIAYEAREGESEARWKWHRERIQGLTEATAADLESLKGLPKLRLLGLRGYGITDAALGSLKSLSSLRELRISYAPFTGVGLLNLRDLKQLRSLSIREGCPMTDDGLSHVATMTHIEVLNLDVRGITGTGLVHLKTLQHLHTLHLRGAHVTDASLENLKYLVHLKKLYLARNKISDGTIRHLAPLTALEELDLRHTGVTGASLARLKNLPKLRSLDLGNVTITDGHLPTLQEFPALEILDLYDTGITFAGLKHLFRLKQLKKLTVNAREVTEAGEAQLRRALPNCDVR